MKTFIENTGLHTMYICGTAISPGEGRDVDVPVSSGRPALVGFDALHDLYAAPALDLIGLLKNNVSAITAKLGSLSLSELDALIDLESEGGSPRKGVLEAVAAEKLTRAAGENTDG